MSYPIWVTPAGDLGVIPESQYYDFILEAYIDGEGYGGQLSISSVENLPPFNRESLGIIKDINIVNAGKNYVGNNGWIELIAEGGLGFAGKARVGDDGKLTNILIANGGYGYSKEQSSILVKKSLEFSQIAGEMPAGLYVTKTGSVQGVPVLKDLADRDKTYSFTVRATNTKTNQVTDRSFTLKVSDVYPPSIVQNKDYLGNYLDGTYFSFQMLVKDVVSASNLTWSIAKGILPLGLSLDANGLISGYLTPVLDQATDGKIYYDIASYSNIGYDSIGRYRSSTYYFTVRVDDGISFSLQDYKLMITSRGSFTTDSSLDLTNISKIEIFALDGTLVSADSSNFYVPIVTTPVQNLPDVRSGANFAFKFDAYDPQREDFNFSISSISLVGYDQNSSVVYDLAPAYDMIDFPCTFTGSTIVIQNQTYSTIDGKANLTVFADSYLPASVSITSTQYLNDVALNFLTLGSGVAVATGDIISQPSVGASGTVYLSSGGTTIKVIETTPGFRGNAIAGNVFIDNIDGLGTLGNTYIYKNGANTMIALQSNTISQITYPTTTIFNPSGNVEVWANTIGYSGTFYANISVTQPSNLPDTGVPYDIPKFDQSGSYLPLSLAIDPITGWLTGYVSPQVDVTRTYEFSVTAYKVSNPSLVSRPVTYYITVLGDLNNSINWKTTSDLGQIDNGGISQFSIEAEAFVSGVKTGVTYSVVNVSNLLPDWIDDNYNAGDTVLYKNYAYIAKTKITRGSKNPADSILWEKYSGGSSLPNGLRLLDNGLIIGRTSFQYFTIDSGLTTIDRNQTIFDNVYYFTVKASSIDKRVTDYKTFKLAVNNYNRVPYENLYLKALPKLEQRKLFLSIVNNQDIFPEDLIYRSKDPWHGRAKDIRSLFLPGLSPHQLSEYVNAIQTNHFTKRINFGAIKTARAADENFNTKYEVVYLDLTDPVLDQGRSPADKMDLTGKINPWYDKEANAYTVFYPNSLDPTIYPGTNIYYGNMKSAVVKNIGFSHQGVLPEWMTSVQPDGSVVGFKHVVVLAYTKPGASNLIAYRLQTAGLEFNQIDFVIDRYDLDNTLSRYFNTSFFKYNSAVETTFDRILRTSIINHSVTYAIKNLPFNKVHRNKVSDIKKLGGFDGKRDFKNGELVVFAQQEQYLNLAMDYDGWIDQISSTEFRVIPGYLDKIASSVIATLLYDASANESTITVEDSTGIEIGYMIEFSSYFSAYTTVKEIIGNTIILENVYDKAITQPITADVPAGEIITFSRINQRAGIWQIEITDDPNSVLVGDTYGSDFGSETIGFETNAYDYGQVLVAPAPLPEQIVSLKFYAPVNLLDRIQVNRGAQLGESTIYYDPTIKADKSVPEYTVLNTAVRLAQDSTRFDSYQTRFINNRDSYQSPTINDKYIKFPKFGVFK